jgi:hypothetical protein
VTRLAGLSTLITDLAVYLVSEESSWVTGAAIPYEGGFKGY